MPSLQTCVRCHDMLVTASLHVTVLPLIRVLHRVLRNPPPRTTAATQQAPQARLHQMMRVCLLLLGCSAANAHGRLTVPRPRPPLWAEPDMQGHTSRTATYRWNEPVFTLNGPMSHSGHAYRADSYRCHDFKAETPQTTVTAGAPLGLAWTLDATHPGDWCASDCSLLIPHLTPA